MGNIYGIVQALCWYSNASYIALANIIGTLFFPECDASLRLIFVLGAFAISYIGRPLGAWFFGWYSDKFGRLNAAYYSLLAFAIATFILGSLPTYSSLGILASLLFIAMQLIQGFAFGGTYTLASTVVEHVHASERYFAGSLGAVGFMVGYLTGSLGATLMDYFFGISFLQEFGWRLPFWVASCAMIFTLFKFFPKHSSVTSANSNLADSNMPSNSNKKTHFGNNPLKDLEKISFISLFKAVSITFLDMVGSYFFFVYFPNYRISVLNHEPYVVWFQISISLLVMLVVTPFIGKAADAYGGLKFLRISAIAYIFFGLFAPWNSFWWPIVFAMTLAFCYAVLGPWMVLLFPKHSRGRASSLVYSLVGMTISIVCPVIFSSLAAWDIRFLGFSLSVVGIFCYFVLFNEKEDGVKKE